MSERIVNQYSNVTTDPDRQYAFGMQAKNSPVQVDKEKMKNLYMEKELQMQK